jgi:hypothetical protein
LRKLYLDPVVNSSEALAERIRKLRTWRNGVRDEKMFGVGFLLK